MGNVALITLHAGFLCLSLCRDTACTNKTHKRARTGRLITYTGTHTGNALKQRGCMCLPGENLH